MTAFRGFSDLVEGRLAAGTGPKARHGLLLIDMQLLDAHPEYGLGRRAQESGFGDGVRCYFDRLSEVVLPNQRLLLTACRDASVPIWHARVRMSGGHSMRLSRRLRSLGIEVSKDSPEGRFLPEVAPIVGETVLDKVTSSVFMSTDLDEQLQAADVSTLIVGGVMTNFCVESTVRNAADLGYKVDLIEDACAAWTVAEHDTAISLLDGTFASVVSARAVVDVIAQMRSDDHSDKSEVESC